METGCNVCRYAVTPKGKQCYTLTRMLKALPSWKLIPEYVIPILDNGCQRFMLKKVEVTPQL